MLPAGVDTNTPSQINEDEKSQNLRNAISVTASTASTASTTSTGSPTVTTSGSDTILTFTGTGSYTT